MTLAIVSVLAIAAVKDAAIAGDLILAAIQGDLGLAAVSEDATLVSAGFAITILYLFYCWLV